MAKKLTLDVKDEELWKEVLRYKIDSGLKNLNDVVVELIGKGLKD